MDHPSTNKPRAVGSDVTTGLFKMYDEEGLREFCPRLASTPQQNAYVQPQSSPLYYSMLNSSHSCGSLTNTSSNSIPSFSRATQNYSHRDLLDVIEASERVSSDPSTNNKFHFGSAPMLRRNFTTPQTYDNTFSRPLFHEMQNTHPSYAQPGHQVFANQFNFLSLPKTNVPPLNHPAVTFAQPVQFQTNVRYVRPSKVCTEGFAVPESRRDIGAGRINENTAQMNHKVPTPITPLPGPIEKILLKKQTTPTSSTTVKPAESLLSGLKYLHRDRKLPSKNSCTSAKSVFVSTPVPLQWADENNIFCSPKFELPGNNFKGNDKLVARGKSRPQAHVDEVLKPTLDKHPSMAPNVNHLKMLSLRDLCSKRSQSDVSDDSGLYSHLTFSLDSESSRSKDKFSSSSGEFTSDASNQNDLNVLRYKVKTKRASDRTAEKPSEECSPRFVDQEQEDHLKIESTGKEEISRSLDSLTDATRITPPNGSAKLHRKPVTPIRSASPVDPKFRGVTLQMRTKVQRDDHVQLSIKAFFNCRKAARPQAKKSPPQVPTLELRRLRKDSTSSSDSDYGVELFPEKKRRTQSSGKQCASCGTKTTPLWRDAEDGTPLCNACGIRYKKYRVRCTRCWHIPRKETKANLQCNNCGEPLRISLFRSKQWKC